jgi:hypothetical protein
MADTFYGISLGDQSPDDVTVGASTSGEVVELRVFTGSGFSKTQLIKALETIKNRILEGNAPA